MVPQGGATGLYVNNLRCEFSCLLKLSYLDYFTAGITTGPDSPILLGQGVCDFLFLIRTCGTFNLYSYIAVLARVQGASVENGMNIERQKSQERYAIRTLTVHPTPERAVAT